MIITLVTIQTTHRSSPYNFLSLCILIVPFHKSQDTLLASGSQRPNPEHAFHRGPACPKDKTILSDLLQPWASYQIHKIVACACTGNAGNVFPATDFNDPGMHHGGTCVAHVPWCMSGSLTRSGGENVPGIPGACPTRNFAYLARGLCIQIPLSRGPI